MVIVAKAARSHSRDAAKSPREIVLVLKTQIEAHVLDPETGAPEEIARAGDPPVQNVSMRAEAGALLKLSGKIVDAQFCLLRELGQADISIQMRIDKSEHAGQASGRQSGVWSRNSGGVRKGR